MKVQVVAEKVRNVGFLNLMRVDVDSGQVEKEGEVERERDRETEREDVQVCVSVCV